MFELEEPVAAVSAKCYKALKRFRHLGEAIKNDFAVKRESKTRILTRTQLASSSLMGIDVGHAVLQNAIDALKIQNEILPFSEDQSKVQQVSLGACCGLIFGDFVKTHEREIREKGGFDSLSRGVIFTAPRRIGKTWCIAALICALYVSVKGIVISIITNNKRSAGTEMGMLGFCKANLQKYFHIPKYKISNDEHLVTEFAPDDIRRISSFSGNIGDGLGKFSFLSQSVCVPYIYGFFNVTKRIAMWSVEDERRLFSYIVAKRAAGQRPKWKEISLSMGRTVGVCRSKVNRMMNVRAIRPDISSWSRVEIKTLALECTRGASWIKVATLVGRSVKSCQDKWRSVQQVINLEEEERYKLAHLGWRECSKRYKTRTRKQWKTAYALL